MKKLTITNVDFSKTDQGVKITSNVHDGNETHSLSHAVAVAGDDVNKYYNTCCDALARWLTHKVNCMMAYGKGDSFEKMLLSVDGLHLKGDHAIPKDWILFPKNIRKTYQHDNA